MKVFFASWLIGLLSVGCFVAWADPAHRWHRRPYPVKAMHRGELWPWPGNNIDQVAAKTAMARVMDTADLVMFGSSRILYPNYTMISERVKLLNLAIGYATISKHRVLWETLKQNQHSPRFAILDLDPWTFNQAWVTKHRHVSSQPRDINVLLELKEMFNLTSFNASVNFLAGRDRLSQGYRWDGTMYRDWYQDLPSAEVLQLMKQQLNGGPFPNLFKGWAVDPHEVAAAGDLLNDLTAHGVKVMVILPPLHPAAYAWVRDNAAWARQLKESTRIAKDLQAGTLGVEICDAADPAEWGCAEDEFDDAIHMNDSCAKKVIEGCFVSRPEWRVLLARMTP